MTAATLDSRLRQIAVLVASVDTAVARQLLLQMPTEIAKRVRAMAADMGPIPPEERRALLAEFQKSQSSSTHSQPVPAGARSDVHFSTTAQAFGELQLGADTPRPEVPVPSGPAWTRLGVETLVRLVRTERPTVVAVVVQQLPTKQAAAVLQRLPRTLTAEVLRQLGAMQDIDGEAMNAIDDHLSEKLRDYHHKVETEMEQSRRMNELLAAAPPEMKQQWASWMRPDIYSADDSADHPVSATASAVNSLDQLYQSATITTSDSQLTHAMSGNTTSSSASSTVATGIGSAQSMNAPAAAPSPKLASDAEEPRIIPISAAANARSNSSSTKSPVLDRAQLQRGMDQILTLVPDHLAVLLSSLDSHTVLLSLAGASPQFMRKFRAMLQTEDAKLLDDRIKRIGAVSLREIDEAQQRLINTYRKIVDRKPARAAA